MGGGASAKRCTGGSAKFSIPSPLRISNGMALRLMLIQEVNSCTAYTAHFALHHSLCPVHYSILFYSILLYSIVFYCILFYSILFYSILGDQCCPASSGNGRIYPVWVMNHNMVSSDGLTPP